MVWSVCTAKRKKRLLLHHYAERKLPHAGHAEGAEEGIRKGIYKLETIEGSKGKVQLLGSGSILRHVREAAQILAKDYGVGSDVYSVTSFTELARDGQDCERWNMLHPLETPRVPYIAQVMNDAPAVASTDYMKLFAEQVRTYVPADDYRVLGTDGFGRSDSRETCVTTSKSMLLCGRSSAGRTG